MEVGENEELRSQSVPQLCRTLGTTSCMILDKCVIIIKTTRVTYFWPPEPSASGALGGEFARNDEENIDSENTPHPTLVTHS